MLNLNKAIFNFTINHLKLSCINYRDLHVENLLIIGSGLMGSGIAQASAESNSKLNSIVVQDVSNEALSKAKTRIASNLKKMKEKNPSIDHDEILSKISFSTIIEPKSTNNLLVIEAVTENLELKQELFKQLDNKFKSSDSVIFVTNTSALSCELIGKHLTNKKRYGGLHFFNPVPKMKLVEVIKLKETSDETFKTLLDFTKDIKKIPVTCKDTPGFIVNRLLLPYLAEAIALLERGDATAKDIDIAMKLGAGYPMGPFELLDYVGLDTTKHIIDSWASLPNPIIKKSKLLDELVEKGHFGKKSGKGFYEY